MTEDDFVPPSDSEEAEELRAEEDGYWDEATAAMRVCEDRTFKRASLALIRFQDVEHVSDSEVSYHSSLSPPKKRRKVRLLTRGTL